MYIQLFETYTPVVVAAVLKVNQHELLLVHVLSATQEEYVSCVQSY